MDFLNLYGTSDDEDSSAAETLPQSAAPRLPPASNGRTGSKALAETSSFDSAGVQASLAVPVEKKRKRVQIVVDLPAGDSASLDTDPTALKAPKTGLSGLFAVLPPPKAASAEPSSIPTLGSSVGVGVAGLAISGLRPSMSRKMNSDRGAPRSSNLPDPDSVIPNRPTPLKETEPDADSFFTLFPADDNHEDEVKVPVGVTIMPTAEPDEAPDLEVPPPHLYSTPYESSYQRHPDAVNGTESRRPARGAIELDDMALAKLGHRAKDGPIIVTDIVRDEQIGDDWKLESARNASKRGSSSGGFDHLRPTKLARVKHNIMSLAFDAKVRENDLAEAYANRRAAKALSSKKYGF
ncbi:hypothetical protein DFJ73DRAFT_70989 [Zopfochytrium polystomum]|nr:hypothetical protein DFJ73DRAFT_70989 [Zopfochytrium polystomum]